MKCKLSNVIRILESDSNFHRESKVYSKDSEFYHSDEVQFVENNPISVRTSGTSALLKRKFFHYKNIEKKLYLPFMSIRTLIIFSLSLKSVLWPWTTFETFWKILFCTKKRGLIFFALAVFYGFAFTSFNFRLWKQIVWTCVVRMIKLSFRQFFVRLTVPFGYVLSIFFVKKYAYI